MICVASGQYRRRNVQLADRIFDRKRQRRARMLLCRHTAEHMTQYRKRRQFGKREIVRRKVQPDTGQRAVDRMREHGDAAGFCFLRAKRFRCVVEVGELQHRDRLFRFLAVRRLLKDPQRFRFPPDAFAVCFRPCRTLRFDPRRFLCPLFLAERFGRHKDDRRGMCAVEEEFPQKILKIRAVQPFFERAQRRFHRYALQRIAAVQPCIEQ